MRTELTTQSDTQGRAGFDRDSEPRVGRIEDGDKTPNIVISIINIFKANPAGIALLLMFRRIWTRIRSSLMAFSLGAPRLRLGPGCRIIGGRHIQFGAGVFVERNLWLEAVTSYGSQQFHPEIVIGDHVSFSDGVHISAIYSIAIGSHTLFGSRIYVADHNHGIYKGETQSRPDEPPALRTLGGGGPVVIGENVWIGDNSVIMGPATIGDGAIIGANSVVRGIVPPHTIAAGAPARLIKVFNFQTGTWDKV
jgi:acetyltransferase-like isoleucine patch superfamily enzyme